MTRAESSVPGAVGERQEPMDVLRELDALRFTSTDADRATMAALREKARLVLSGGAVGERDDHDCLMPSACGQTGFYCSKSAGRAVGERPRMMVPTRLLRCEWPPNDGVLPGDPQFDDLYASIQRENIREPLTIKLDWSVIDGAHRLSAARLLDIEWVPVRVWTGVEFLP